MSPQTPGPSPAEVLQRMEVLGIRLARSGVAFEEVAGMARQVRRGWTRWWLRVIAANTLRRRGQR